MLGLNVYDEGLKFEVFDHDMCDFFVDKEVHQFGEIGFAFYYFQICHLCINEFPRHCIKIDFDGAEWLLVAHVDGLGKMDDTLYTTP